MRKRVRQPREFEFRYGNPRTDWERAQRHEMLYPGSQLPPRGTGRISAVDKDIATGALVGSLAAMTLILVLVGIERSKR